MIKIAIVTNEPPPYRIPVFQRIARMPGVDLRVFFCARREPNRQWKLPPLEFEHEFLRERISTVKGRYIHNNPDVVPALRRFAPEVLVTDGFNPTQLYAFTYAAAKGIAHVPLTDGTLQSEQALSIVHRLVRRIVFARSSAFLSASTGGQHLYESYGIAARRCFRSYLCIDNDLYQRAAVAAEKRHDLIFCGRMVPEKGPLFALRAALEAARQLERKVSILFVGAGSEEQRVREAAAQYAELVDVRFHGFAQQQELPALYASARIFLFPTHADVWGVVANEACAAGLPVIVSPYAGVAGELVLHGENGYICELDAQLWAEHVATLLTDDDLRERFARRNHALVREYTFDNAARGLVDACRFALAAGEPSKAGKPA
jgi:glycosyltransferase involved in cell wall biosynthesis